jgi:hypothetical protein
MMKSAAARRRGRPPASIATKRMIVSLRPSPGCRSASSLESQLCSTQMKAAALRGSMLLVGHRAKQEWLTRVAARDCVPRE